MLDQRLQKGHPDPKFKTNCSKPAYKAVENFLIFGAPDPTSSKAAKTNDLRKLDQFWEAENEMCKDDAGTLENDNVKGLS